MYFSKAAHFCFDTGSDRTMDKVSLGKIGKYDIIKVLGRGGMGEVILAQDEDLGRRVAIKRPFQSALQDGLARFQVEARAATLNHPNIPAVYEMGVQDGLPFIAMEFVEGESLDKIIASGRQLDLIFKLRIIEQVCSALGYAHEKGIIHRDIKPANVIVQPDGVAKIIDFGIAKIQDPEGNAALTQTSQILGSLYYIAPERFKGEAIDGRVDIFSAGVMLYKLLTGIEPFTGGEATASYKIVNEAHTSLATYLQDYPPALDGILEKALAKNPDDRYLVAEDFGDALHEVIEELKRTRVFQLFDDAERLATESRFTPALELLDEAIKLDPANTQARKLRKLVREHQDRIKRAERLREFTARADEALLSENYEETITQLKEAEKLDPSSVDLKQRIQSAEEKKRRYDTIVRSIADADLARKRGDITGALRIVAKALQDDPQNKKLLALNEALVRQAEIEAQQGKLLEILESARREIAARNFAAADKLLEEAEGIDPSHLETDKLRREVAKAREQQERQAILTEIQRRVSEFLRRGSYDQASDLLNRAISKLPNETQLHRLKAETDSEARKFEAKRLVDGAISQAKEVFATSPFEALAVIEKALDQMPGEERLLSYERSLRHQLDALRVDQSHAETLLKARQLMEGKQFDKAIGVLESYQLEFGHHTDIDDLLTFAREELASLQRIATIGHCATEARSLARQSRLDEAIRVLESGIQATGDASLTSLLEEVQQQQVVSSRKAELLQKRIGLLRDRGELDEAIQLLREHLAAAPGSAQFADLLTALLAEQEQKQATSKAIAAAGEAVQKKDFAAGLESLQAVARAYGESAELTRAMQEVQDARSSHAQEIVGKSIESARAALLKNDPHGALAALKGATQVLEFADTNKRADWQRLGQSVKKALEQSETAAHGAAFDAQISEIAAAKPRRMPIWLIAAAGAALLAIAALVVWKLQPPPPSSVAHIRIAKAPPGASISIDNGPASQANASGELTVPVKPGSHQLQISKDGFEPFTDKLEVNPGETVQDVVSLTRLLPAGTSGTLSAQGNVGEFKLSVDGKNMGLHRAGESIRLELGTHKVRYTAQDNSDAQEHTIQIAANQNTPDTFFLKPTTPKSATAANTQPAKQLPAPVPQTQAAVSQPIAAAPAVVQPTGTLSVSANSIERGKPVQLTWQVSNASAVSISDIGPVAPQGGRTVYPIKATTYQLTANGITLSEQTVNVTELAPPPTVASPQPRAPAGPDRAALESALNAYKGLFSRASGKSSKECKVVLSGAYQGRLQALARWCDSAKSFDVAEQCSSVSGTLEAPTLTCMETLVIHPKDGDPQPSHGQKTFHFGKSADGTWQVSGW
jgi:serine/threonine-protein kinase